MSNRKFDDSTLKLSQYFLFKRSRIFVNDLFYLIVTIIFNRNENTKKMFIVKIHCFRAFRLFINNI